MMSPSPQWALVLPIPEDCRSLSRVPCKEQPCFDQTGDSEEPHSAFTTDLNLRPFEQFQLVGIAAFATIYLLRIESEGPAMGNGQCSGLNWGIVFRFSGYLSHLQLGSFTSRL